MDVIEYLNLGSFFTGVARFFPRLLSGIVVFAIIYVVYYLTVWILRKALERKKFHDSLTNLTVKTYKYIMMIAGVILGIHQMGINIGAALTGIGIISVGLGFAARDSLSNYVAGITIFWDKPFIVGDYIEVQGQYGRVTEITMRSTRIRTLQNEYVIVPNQDIVNEFVVNHSKNGEVRVEMPVGILYRDSITQARAVLLALIDPEQDARLSRYLRPTVVVRDLGDNGVNLIFRVWINKAEDEKQVFYDYIEKAKHALEEHGLTIPFPQRTLHVEDVAWQENQKTPL